MSEPAGKLFPDDDEVLYGNVWAAGETDQVPQRQNQETEPPTEIITETVQSPTIVEPDKEAIRSPVPVVPGSPEFDPIDLGTNVWAMDSSRTSTVPKTKANDFSLGDAKYNGDNVEDIADAMHDLELYNDQQVESRRPSETQEDSLNPTPHDETIKMKVITDKNQANHQSGPLPEQEETTDYDGDDSDESGDYYTDELSDEENAPVPVLLPPPTQSAIDLSRSIEREMQELNETAAKQLPTTAAPESPIPAQTELPGSLLVHPESKTLMLLPDLRHALTDEQKVGLCALCLLCSDELIRKYAYYEYFPLNPEEDIPLNDDVLNHREHRKKRRGRKLRADEVDGLLEDLTSEDEALEYLGGDGSRRRRSSSSKPGSATQTTFPKPVNKTRRPPKLVTAFKNWVHDPEELQDFIFFQRSMTGNRALCFQLKSWIAFRERIMNSLYAWLDISAGERGFLEQAPQLGLQPEEVVKCLLPNTTGDIPPLYSSQIPLIPVPEELMGETVNPLSSDKKSTPLQTAEKLKAQIKEQANDRRPLILWNLFLLFQQLNAEKNPLDAHTRVFIRLIGNYMKTGFWVDMIDAIEMPFLRSLRGTAMLYYEQQMKSRNGLVDEWAAAPGADDPNTPQPGQRSLTNFHQEYEKQTRVDAAKKKKEKKSQRKRAAMITAAAIGGGAIIGISTGLAAPMLGAGIGAALAAMKVAGASTFLSSVASTALITSGGVLTGTSVATIKMARRTGEVEFFRFIPVVTNKKTKPAGDAAAPPTAGEHSDIQKTLDFDVKKQSGLLIISISGWITSKDGTGKQLTSTDSVPRTSQESASRASSSTPTRPRAESRASGTSQDPSTPTSEKAPKNMADAQQDLYEILANGQHDLILPFSGLSPINGPHYALCFSPDTLRSLGDALKMLASEVISFSTTQLLQQTILSGVLSALTWPMWLVKLGYLVDNPWSIGLVRAKKAGEILADALCSNIQQNQPVTLIGYSLGARVIWYCLLHLAQKGRLDVVEDAFLFGAPVLMPLIASEQGMIPGGDGTTASSSGAQMGRDRSQSFGRMGEVPAASRPGSAESIIEQGGMDADCFPSPVHVDGLRVDDPNRLASLDEWRQVVSAVSGHLYNCYARSDWVLGFLFRASVAGVWDVAGLRPVIIDSETSPNIITLKEDEDGKEKGKDPKDKSKDSKDKGGKEAKDKGKTPTASETILHKEPLKAKHKNHHPGVLVNVDVTDLVPGHLAYRQALPHLLQRLTPFQCWSSNPEEIEMIMAGEWLDALDGWWGMKQGEETGSTLLGMAGSSKEAKRRHRSKSNVKG